MLTIFKLNVKYRTILLFKLLFLMLFCVGCSDNDALDKKQIKTTELITIETKDSDFERVLISAEYTYIDWGDGQSSEGSGYINSEGNVSEPSGFDHHYKRKGNYVITIKTQKATELLIDNITAEVASKRIVNLGRCNYLKTLHCNNVMKIENVICPVLLYFSITGKYFPDNIGDFKNVTGLAVHVEGLKSLDVSTFENLVLLDCQYSNLTALKVPDNIVELNCFSNELKSLDVSNCNNLYLLDCTDNRLESLVFKKQSKLTKFFCGDNKLQKEALDDIFTSLPINELGDIQYTGNPGTSICNPSIFLEKGWLEVTYY